MKRSWSAREWLPKAATLALIGVTTTAEGVVVEADGPSSARCPACRRRSHSRHSRYWRTLKDLAAQGRAVTLRVHVSRWRCKHRRCETAIFADRLTGVSAPRVHHTHRFGAVGHLVGHALGGRGGERLLARLGMGISNDTILRVLKRPTAEPLAPDVLHVVGIDDWAWQKGQHQGRTTVTRPVSFIGFRELISAVPPLRDDSGGFGASAGRGRPPGAHGRCGGRLAGRPSRHRDHQPRSARPVCPGGTPWRAAGHP